MSSIDRAFIKAYSDEPSLSVAHSPTANTTEAMEGASAKAITAAQTTTSQSPRRAASRTKRTTSAAAIRGAAQTSPSTPPQQAPSMAASSLAPPPPASVGVAAKMVVGRQALKQLAETAAVPAPHAAFVQNRRAATSQVESLPTPNASATMQRAPLAAAASRQVNDNPRAAPRATAPAIESRHGQLRLDAAASAAAEPPVAALEVDCLAWPPACEALINAASADFDAIATQLSHQAENCPLAIAVLSIDEGHGGTTVAMCLARVLAQRGTRVCLVDGDYRQPGLAERLGLNLECGLESVLSGEAVLGEVLVESLDDHLLLLPLTRPLAADVVERSKLRQTAAFGELRDQYDVVLVDAGSLGAAPALRFSMLGAGVVDSVILVGRQSADVSTWERALELLAEWNVPCLGAIANRCTL
jgi:Mrp family chromosome partitioning ATPase